jgi:hypothetical protein
MIDGVHAMIDAEKACIAENAKAPAEEVKPTEEAKAEPAVVAEAAPAETVEEPK